jgi:hypothetical protein
MGVSLEGSIVDDKTSSHHTRHGNRRRGREKEKEKENNTLWLQMSLLTDHQRSDEEFAELGMDSAGAGSNSFFNGRQRFILQ